MGSKLIIFGIWFLGFMLGFAGYIAYPWIGNWLMEVMPQIFINETLVGALLSGIAGSLITTVAVIVWSRISG